MTEKKIVLADEDEVLLASLQRSLKAEGYTVYIASNCSSAIERVHRQKPDVLVLDANLVVPSSRRSYRNLRNQGAVLVMAVIQGRRADEGIEADGYMAKPFTCQRLLKRLEAMLVREEPTHLRLGELELDLERQSVARGGESHRLTPKEFALLKLFMRNPGEVLTRRIVMREVWVTDYLGDTRTLDVHIHHLRRKIEENPSLPEHLLTVRRVGYILREPSPG